MLDLSSKIRDIPDFPIQGILFRDITTLLMDGEAFRASVDQLAERVQHLAIDVIVGMESRGFIFAAPLAYKLGVGFVPVRKLGKLPGDTVRVQYDLEYGSNTLEIHRDALSLGQRVLIVDDLLATGGTVGATIQLIEELGAEVVGAAFLIELTELGGRNRMENANIVSVIAY